MDKKRKIDRARHRWRVSCAVAAPHLFACALLPAPGASADDEDLAKQLSNPVAALISVPLQINYDDGIGSAREGSRWTTNIQPVVPITLSPDWNLISRTITPITSQSDIAPGAGSQFGLGDILQSVFFSPSQPTSGGLIWGAGPAFLLPTGTDPLLSSRKLGFGPTGVVLKQSGPWTMGALANHIWSVAGGGRRELSSTFLQPFLAYTTPSAWTFTVNTEMTYDWERHQLGLPINALATKLLKIGGQPISIGGGVRYWAATSGGSPHGWGGRMVLTFLFPK
jgi:hypothetical protein